MGAPVGNQYAAKSKQWAMAIERALDKRGAYDRKLALDALAEVLLTKCDEGDMAALRELGDRLDGKSAQAMTLDATVRSAESLTEEQSRMMAEAIIEQSKRAAAGPSRADTVHDSLPAGLPSS